MCGGWVGEYEIKNYRNETTMKNVFWAEPYINRFIDMGNGECISRFDGEHINRMYTDSFINDPINAINNCAETCGNFDSCIG